MAVRTVEYTVSAKEIKPSALQCGGIQGEHNATELVFLFDKDFKEQLISLETTENKKVYYRFEAYTGSGIKAITDPQPFSADSVITFALENWITRDGGKVRVHLVVSYIDTQNDETLMDMYTYPAFLKLDAVPDGQISDEEEYESMPTLTASAKNSAIRAEVAADSAKDAKIKAEAAAESTNNTYVSLTEDTFVFVGGDSQTPSFKIELIIDGEMSDESGNPVQNKVVKKYIDGHISELNGKIGNLIAVGSAEEMEVTDSLFFFVID